MAKLQSQVNDLTAQVYKNNFSSSQTFNKACKFTDRLNIPGFNSAPTVAEVNDIIAVAGEMYICTSINPVVFTLVGSQT